MGKGKTFGKSNSILRKKIIKKKYQNKSKSKNKANGNKYHFFGEKLEKIHQGLL